MNPITPFYVPASDPEIFAFMKSLEQFKIRPDSNLPQHTKGYYGIDEHKEIFWCAYHQAGYDMLTARQGIARLNGWTDESMAEYTKSIPHYEIGKEYEFSDDEDNWSAFDKGEFIAEYKGLFYMKHHKEIKPILFGYKFIRPIKPSVRDRVLLEMKMLLDNQKNDSVNLMDETADRIIQIVKGEQV